MIELGKIQNLIISNITKFGAYLTKNEDKLSDTDDKVLLPTKFLPENADIGDIIEVFVYKDSSDRIIATTKKPYIVLGETSYLMVKEVTKIGAFLDWGLEKDLLLPYSEQTVGVNRGDSYLIRLYVDKSNRLCASMKLYDHLDTCHNYKKGDTAKGIIFDKNDNYGYFVAIDNKYLGMISKKEAYGNLYIGKEIDARIINVRDDNKLELAVRAKTKDQILIDADKIVDMMKSSGGKLPFTENDSPENIKRQIGMSKAQFKRAIGHLLKENKVVKYGEEIVFTN